MRMLHARVMYLVFGALVGGFVINALVAECLGWWGRAELSQQPPWRFVAAGPDAAEVRVVRGFGRTALSWRSMSLEDAWMWQRVRAQRQNEPVPADLGFDPAESVPRWCSVWEESHRASARAANTANMRASGALVSPPTDIAVGWPALSFVVSTDLRVLGTLPAGDPALVVRGGYVHDLPISQPISSLRVLALGGPSFRV